MIVCYRILHKLDCSSFNIKGIGSKKHFFLHQKFLVLGWKEKRKENNVCIKKGMSAFGLLSWSIGAFFLFIMRHEQRLPVQFTLVFTNSFPKTSSRDQILRHSFHIIQANFDQNPIFEFPLTDGHLHPILQSREYSLSNSSGLSNHLQLFSAFSSSIFFGGFLSPS